MTIKELLQHPWIQKYNKSNLPNLRKQGLGDSISPFKIYTISEDPNAG